MKKTRTIICMMVFMVAQSAMGAVINVPADYATIQEAIEATFDYDTVVIEPGTYSGGGNINLNFRGKLITVQSTEPDNVGIVRSTIIDCEGIIGSRGFEFGSGETSDAAVKGLTVIGGNLSVFGGAVYCYNGSNPTISNCVFKGNQAFFGGAVAVGNNDSRPTITGCTITGNTAGTGGGGLYIIGGSPTVSNCLIAGNFASRGGAIWSQNEGNPVITGCTIAGNAASVWGGAIYCYNGSNMEISNSILWGNVARMYSEVYVKYMAMSTSMQFSYCDIQGGQDDILVDSGCTLGWSQNVDVDPMFVFAGYVDTLKSYVEGDWHLMETSPCIDTGDPGFVAGVSETDIDGNERVSGGLVDIGADEYLKGIEVDVRIMPKTLNLSSKGNYINCSIAVENGYSIADIDTSTILLHGVVVPESISYDAEEDKLMIKFDRAGTQQLLEGMEGEVSLIVKGKLTNDMDFEGNDTINLIDKGGKK
ncbi:MAG: hypothetical protein KAR47_09960 [Planctomycetes bacterium]|nr:hypothetical protein [Planctomycetota bacterium]